VSLLYYCLQVASALLENPDSIASIFTINIAISQLRKCSGKSAKEGAHVALSLLKKMRKAGLEPTAASYVSVIAACTHAGMSQEGFHVFASMKASDVKPEVRAYTAMISLCYKCGEFANALDIYNEMVDVGVSANEETYNTLIAACGKAGQLEVRFHGCYRIIS
jgi:pentatricopeptide repeat protein